MTTTLPDPRVKSKPELTAERARELFDYDPETGALKWKNSRIKANQGQPAGVKHHKGYLIITVDQQIYLVLRVIWLIVYGEWPKFKLKHINFNQTDNRLANLEDRQHTGKLHEISAEYAKSVLSYDPVTGEFVWVKGRNRGKVAGVITQAGYRIITVARKIYLASRLAWLVSTGEWPECFIDHINGNKDDNRLNNLRNISRRGNVENQRKAMNRNKSSGLLGVSKGAKDNKWKAKIHSHGCDYQLGRYDTKEEAHLAYVIAKRLLHPGCTI